MTILAGTTDAHRFAILLAGPLRITERVRGQVQCRRTIAADGGIAHAASLDLVPELWMGDFDSSSASDGDRYATMERTAFPAAKNATDGALAIQKALELGARDILLVGALGGRSDHSFALMAYATALAQNGNAILLSNGDEEGTPLTPTQQVFDYAPGTLFSVLGFTALQGLTLGGVYWPLDAIHLPFGDSLSISNEVTSTLTARVASGNAMLLAHINPGAA